MGRVLVVDDEKSLRDVLEVLISSKGHAVLTAKNVGEAKTRLDSTDFDLVVTDLRLEPGGDGMDVVRHARSRRSPPEIIVMTAYGTRQKALQAQEYGALFYLEKGPHLATDMSVLVAQAVDKRKLQLENALLREQLLQRNRLEGVVGKSDAMKDVFELVERIAPTRANVLLVGESGTGKERIARAIHYHSNYAEGPFVPLNCGAIPENLIEAELFGHTKGAFTGADEAKPGMFEAAEAGTIFLDEIGELPLSLQPKLLRVLQERTVKPVGANVELEVDVRVLAATNRDLEAEVDAGRFREDLYFRLNVLQIDVPPLRERKEDLALLATTFLHRYSEEYHRDVDRISPAAMELLLGFMWPGNVRQLENVVERAVALSTGHVLDVAQLPKALRESEPLADDRRVKALDLDTAFPEAGVDLEQMLEDLESKLILAALDSADGVKTKAAELLGLTFRQFRYKLGKNERLRELIRRRE